MIYITGDTHGDWMSRLNTHNFPEQKSLSKKDYVIICGDFGLWHDTPSERYALKWLENKTFTTLFCEVIMIIMTDLILSQLQSGMVVRFIK